MLRSAKRCAADPGPIQRSVGPGSAEQREERCTASGTRETPAPFSRSLIRAAVSIFKQHYYYSPTQLRDLAACFRASFANNIPLSEIRGRRECRAPAVPAALWANS